MHRLAVLAIASSLVPLAADAKCARTELVPKLLTTRDRNLPADGGVLVGYENQVYDQSGPHTTGDPSEAAWVGKSGKGKVALARTSLAPGLSVYKPAGSGAITIENGAGATVGTFTRDPKAAKNTMTAPVAIDVALSVDKNPRWSSRHVNVHLKAAPPAAAAAVIVYSGDTAISFVTLPDTHDALTTFDAFVDGGHCGSVPDGGRPPTKGEKVTFAWVDAFGRLSPKSAPVAAT